MATTFEEIRTYVRVILGDDDSQNYLFLNSTINQHIRLEIFATDAAGIVESTIVPEEFTLVLAGKDQAILAYRVSRSIISGQPDHFSYRNPVISVTRTRGVKQLISQIDMSISRLQGGFLCMREDNEIFAVESFIEREQRDYSDSLEEVYE